jgi:hypothetical protein
MLMKTVNLFLAIIFLVAAILQYNDPDPYVWMPIYLYVCVLCALAIRHKFYPKAYVAGIVIYSIYACYLFFTKDGVLDWIRAHQSENIALTMQATKPWIEQTREFFGLLICIIALLLNYYFSKVNERLIEI